jgi:cation transport regulator
MPYDKNSELPDNVRVLPAHAQDIYREAFNNAYEQHKDEPDREPRSHAIAWSAVERKYHKNDQGEWVEKAARKRGTRDFTGVEIARTGTFEAQTGKVTFTTKDFDNAHEAYEALKEAHHPVIKLGHDEHQKLLQEDGYPNAGFLENIRREGDRLLADLTNVPAAIADLIQAGRYRARSLEAMRNFEVDGKVWPFVITGLALLGADLPAVDSLEDVAAVYASQGLDWPEGNVVVVITASQGVQEDVDSLINELQELLKRTETLIYRRGGAPKFRALVKTAVDELKTITRKTKAKKEVVKDMELTKLIELLELNEDADDEAVMAKLTEMKEKAAKGNGSDPDAVARLQSELAEAQKRIVALEGESATEKARREVDEAIKARKFTPASRDTLIKLATGNPVEFGEMVKATPDNAVLASIGEKGSDGDGNNDIGELEPTQSELNIAARMNTSREELIEQKARDAGKPVPESIAKVLAERRSK